MLILPIKKKWYDMILDGVKTEEYMVIKPYWTKRFKKVFSFSPFDGYPTGADAHEILFRSGYGNNAPSFTALCTLEVSMGKEEWGAESGVNYYVLKILEVRR